jgi:hypothetical protein
MKVEDAEHILKHDFRRWREVWKGARFAAWGASCSGHDAVFDRGHNAAGKKSCAARALNLVRLLVPITGRCSCRQDHGGKRCLDRPPSPPGPDGGDVFRLYMQVLMLAKGDGHWRKWLGDETGGDWLYGDRGWYISWGKAGSEGIVYEDGTVECGSVCPPLPKLE